MDNLNETFEKPEFDWSAISVGDYKLDHSQNFFANKENNRNLDNENLQQLTFSNCSTSTTSKVKVEDAENEAMVKLQPTKGTSQLPPKEIPAMKSDLATVAGAGPVQLEEQNQTDETKVDQLVMYDDIENMLEAEAVRPTIGNLRLQWSPIPNEHKGTGAGAAAASVPVPKAYAFMDLYERNRQHARLQQEEEDRQARQFHSRPMPNFKAMHKRIDDKVVVHRITVPKTPETVKYWQSCVERRRQAKRDQEEKLRNLSQEHPHTCHKTFNLLSDQRVRDRRAFDSAVQERQVQKRKEQEEQRKRC
ncbi:hypothetical protein KR032_000296, partial [Drosophila birchii]